MSNNSEKNSKVDTNHVNETPQASNLISSLNDLQLSLSNSKNQSSLSKPLRDVALKEELEQLRKINESISNISDSIDITDTSLKRMINHTEQSNELLNLWIKILSQNHHTYNLLKDKENWNGSSEFELNHEQKLLHLQQLEDKLQQMKDRKKKEEELKRQRDEERLRLLSKKDKRIYRV